MVTTGIANGIEAAEEAVAELARRLLGSTLVTVQTIAPVVEDQAFNLTLELDVDASLALRPSGSWLLRPVIRQIASN